MRRMTSILLLLVLLLLGLSSSTSPTLSTIPLFQNTIKRWNIQIQDPIDRSQRWARFVAAKAAVDRTTSGVTLDSLNLFTVLNDREYQMIVEPMTRHINSSTVLNFINAYNNREPHRSANPGIRRKKRDIPATFTSWEEDVGLVTPSNQLSCGSCWSFPTVGAIEAVNKKMTGDGTAFSQQYFVDCTFNGDGCGGGKINDGFVTTKVRQYLPSLANTPYTADYRPCTIADDITSFTNNAMTKIWLANEIPLSISEDGFLGGLEYSPVAFGSYISNDLISYSGGEYEDVNCESDGIAHAMLLVGYTETTLRVKASYGANFGDGGYITYVRGSQYLSDCSFYKTAFAITATLRRDMEYEYCNNTKVVTYGDCKKSCTEMGMTLAVIPSLYHNMELMAKFAEDNPGVKSDDKFNYYWIGIVDMEKNGEYEWLDGVTPVNYVNLTENTAKYGMINKNTGNWAFKNSLTYEARGVCSRAVTCWDISTAVKYGEVTFSQTPLTVGTTATVSCNDGGTLSGAATLTCSSGGVWSDDLPTCSLEPGSCTYADEGGPLASLSPDKTIFSDQEVVTVTCASDDRQTTHKCTNGALSPVVEVCAPGTCTADDIPEGMEVEETVEEYEEGDSVLVYCGNNATRNHTLLCSNMKLIPELDGEAFCETVIDAALHTNLNIFILILSAVCLILID